MESLVGLKIIKIDNDNYTFIDSNNNIYNLNIKFYDIDNNLSIGDYIYMNIDYLDSKITLRFGKVTSKYGKDVSLDNIDEVIVIKKNNYDEEIYLKRIYG